MFKKLLNKNVLKNEKGMTLIELLAVIVILAIVAAIAIPAIGNIIQNSRYNAAKADALSIINAASLYYADVPNGEAAGTGTPAIPSAATTAEVLVIDLVAMGYLENSNTFKADATAKVSKNGHKLTGTATYSTSKTIEFTGATITGINADTQKGSSNTALTDITS